MTADIDASAATAGPTWVAAARRRKGVVDVEGISREWHPRYRTSRILLVDEGVPLRWLPWSGVPPTPEQLDDEFPVAVPPPAPEPLDLPTATVVICTRNRPESLRRCLTTVLAGIDEDADVLVIDNSPANPATREVLVPFARAGLPVRSVPLRRAGLSGARNLSLSEAQGDIVAFIDDDVLVERGWLTPIRRAFADHPSNAMVLGLVPPAELETDAQVAFERRLPWSTRFKPVGYSMRDRPRASPFPYNAGQLGAGANMALRRRVALDLGGFDPALGAGTWTRGGEDLEMFVRILRSGAGIYYEPSSIVWHVHQRNASSVRRQLVTYGTGATAYWTSMMTRPGRGDVLRACVPLLRTTLKSRRDIVHTQDEMQLELLELIGLLGGPLTYGAERLRQRVVRMAEQGRGRTARHREEPVS